MLRKFVVASAISLLLATPAFAGYINVAEDATVTLNGLFGQLRPNSGWDYYDPADASTLTDGDFLAMSTTWNDGTVWWDETVSGPGANSIEIYLGGWFDLYGFIVQADDNDTYLLEYWDGSSWLEAWSILATGGWGMQTRPSTTDFTEMYNLGSPISTDRLRFTATGGDYFYSVSEIQAFAISEPGTLALLGIGLLGMGLVARLRK